MKMAIAAVLLAVTAVTAQARDIKDMPTADCLAVAEQLEKSNNYKRIGAYRFESQELKVSIIPDFTAHDKCRMVILTQQEVAEYKQQTEQNRIMEQQARQQRAQRIVSNLGL